MRVVVGVVVDVRLMHSAHAADAPLRLCPGAPPPDARRPLDLRLGVGRTPRLRPHARARIHVDAPPRRLHRCAPPRSTAALVPPASPGYAPVLHPQLTDWPERPPPHTAHPVRCVLWCGVLWCGVLWCGVCGACVCATVFVALMKQYVLRDELKPHMWAGVTIIALAVCLVGASPMIDDKEDDAEEGGGGDDQLPLGLALTIGGTFMQSLQYVYEEKMMSGDTKVSK